MWIRLTEGSVGVLSIIEGVQAMINDYADAQAKFMAEMRTRFGDVAKKFFVMYPEIGVIAWNQYTPYFNDGELCKFGRGDIFAADAGAIGVDDINGAYDLDDGGYFTYSGKPSEYVYKNRDRYVEYAERIERYEAAVELPRYEEVSTAWAEFKRFLESIPDEVYLDLFDDHVTVIMTPSGVTTKEYEHD
jgi:hypothetical protein